MATDEEFLLRATAERVEWLKARPALKVDELLEIAPVSRSTVMRAIRSGDLRVNRLGRSVLISTEVALAWLAGSEPPALVTRSVVAL